jgi:hypothetical protein
MCNLRSKRLKTEIVEDSGGLKEETDHSDDIK